MARHPQHDAVHDAVRRWYTASTPAIGLAVRATPDGFLTDSDRAERKRLILMVDRPERVAEALATAAGFYRTAAFEVWVDDRARADRLTPALLARWSAEGAAHGVRSQLINCDAGGPAEALYRRLGFTDENYWYRRYHRGPAPA